MQGACRVHAGCSVKAKLKLQIGQGTRKDLPLHGCERTPPWSIWEPRHLRAKKSQAIKPDTDSSHKVSASRTGCGMPLQPLRARLSTQRISVVDASFCLLSDALLFRLWTLADGHLRQAVLPVYSSSCYSSVLCPRRVEAMRQHQQPNRTVCHVCSALPCMWTGIQQSAQKPERSLCLYLARALRETRHQQS